MFGSFPKYFFSFFRMELIKRASNRFYRREIIFISAIIVSTYRQCAAYVFVVRER